jgi:sugar diacid utilization regulator
MFDELQVIAESLASQLGRSVAIDDPHMTLLVHTARRNERVDQHRVDSILQMRGGAEIIEWVMSHGIADATDPVRIPGSAEVAAIGRVCIPVRCRGILLGYLWLLDPDGTIPDSELETAAAAAALAGDVLFRERLMGDVKRGREREWTRDLISSDQEVREHAAQLLADNERLPAQAHVVAMVVHVEDTAGRSSAASLDLALDQAVRRLSPSACICITRGGNNGLLLVAATTPLKLARIKDVASLLQADVASELKGTARVRVGVGHSTSPLHTAHETYASARRVLRILERVDAFGDTASWDELGVYKMLAQISLNDVERQEAIPRGLMQLIESDPSRTLIDTLETYLDEAGSAPATTKKLQIHRTSLYYRLDRIQERTGMSLRNGEDRLALHVGLRVARLVGIL